MLVFGLGYTASRIATALRERGWDVHATGSAGNLAFDDEGSVRVAIGQASHILSSVPPMADGDPVLLRYGDALKRRSGWTGYLSSTGVYGDTGGAWVDESAAVAGRRQSRNQADSDWLALGAHVFRLPGIYGPGRSPFERIAASKAHRAGLPHQIFSRIHVDDIVTAVLASFDAPAGAFNIADDEPCSQDRVIEAACDMTGTPYPQTVSLDTLSAEARSFYAENRRVANGKAKRVFSWTPLYPSYAEGLRALSAIASPASASTDPSAASRVHS